MDINPARSIVNPTVIASKIEPIDVEDIQCLLKSPRRTVLGYRDKAIMELLYATGVSVTKLTQLQLTQLDLDKGSLKLARGKDTYHFDLPPNTQKHLLRYLEKSRNVLLQGEKSSYIFVSRLKKPLTRMMVWKILRRYADQVGVSFINSRRLKQSIIVYWLDQGKASPMCSKG